MNYSAAELRSIRQTESSFIFHPRSKLRGIQSKIKIDDEEEKIVVWYTKGMFEGVPGAPPPPDPLKPESRERLAPSRTAVVVFDLGGTVSAKEEEGRLVGKGILGDHELAELESPDGGNINLDPESIKENERRLAGKIYERMKQALAHPVSTDEALAWAEDNPPEYRGPVNSRMSPRETREYIRSLGGRKRFADYAAGDFITLFNGQSSNLRPAITAPAVAIMIDQAVREPDKSVLGLIGTDFGPEAILPLIDVLVFDTRLPAFIFSGASNPKEAQNIVDMAAFTGKNIPRLMYPSMRKKFPSSALSINQYYSGAFWIFEGEVFSAASILKFDPAHTEETEWGTFFSPGGKSKPLTRKSSYSVAATGEKIVPEETNAPPENHIARRLSMEKLYEALTKVRVVDVGDDNPVEEQVQQILDPEIPAVVVATHGLGSANNYIKRACIEAAKPKDGKHGKLVIIVSRALKGEVSSRDAQAVKASDTFRELYQHGALIIEGHQLDKKVAKALMVRALLEGRDQLKTQDLVWDYCVARGLFKSNMFPEFLTRDNS